MSAIGRAGVRVFAVGVLLAFCGITAAQEPGSAPLGRGGQPMPGGRGGRFGMPPRDNAPARTGTAKITGRVLSAETGAPIRRAQVVLSSRDDARVARNIPTDSEGRYELGALPAGRYRLYVTKAGYVQLEYGQARPYEAGKPLDLVDGQVLEKIDFSLPRDSVITGRITDEFGDPITDVQVQALRFHLVNGERQLVTAGRTARTDDLGQYRIFGLLPGDYMVHASLREGQRAGREGSADATGYPGTYYPGVADVGQAQTVAVTIGQELSSIGFPLVPARFARVTGTVFASDGRPLSGAVLMMRPQINASGSVANLLAGAGRSAADGEGRFRLANVPPGEYVLEVQQRPERPQNLGNAFAQLEFASVPLSVSGDIDNLTVSTTPGVSVSGRVVYQGQNPPRTALQIMAVAPDGAPALRALAGRALGTGRVSDTDGSFEIHGLLGPQLLRVQNIPSGWMLKGVHINGTDVTDVPFDFRPGSNITGAVVTLTDRLSEISGSVRDVRGQMASDYVVVVFPEDATLWRPYSRFLQTARPNQNGVFSIKGMPLGRYLAAAVPSLENGLQNDPTTLERLRSGAEGFSLAEGGVVNLNLQMN